MNYLARFILWFFATYVAITLFGIFSPDNGLGLFGYVEYALFHILTGNADLKGYEPVARMFIFIIMFMKVFITLIISAAITGVQYAQSKR